RAARRIEEVSRLQPIDVVDAGSRLHPPDDPADRVQHLDAPRRAGDEQVAPLEVEGDPAGTRRATPQLERPDDLARFRVEHQRLVLVAEVGEYESALLVDRVAF